jgi:putative acetyltransferase
VPITIHQGELDRSDVQELLALHVAAMRAHSPPEACHVLPGSALAHPSITFFTAREGAQLLGIGALKDLGDGTGEIKSMHRTLGARPRGPVARSLPPSPVKLGAAATRCQLLETALSRLRAGQRSLRQRALCRGTAVRRISGKPFHPLPSLDL